MSEHVNVPGDWHNILASEDNKKELFSFPLTKLIKLKFQVEKCVYTTSVDQILTVGSVPPMGPCSRKEADTCVLIHNHTPQYFSYAMQALLQGVNQQ